MSREQWIAVGVISLFVIFAVGVGFGLESIPHGYSGLTAKFVDVEDTNDFEGITDTGDGSYATWKPNIVNPGWWPTGLRAELGQPNFESIRDDYDNTINVIDETAKTNTTKTWKVQVVKMTFGVTIRTDGGGLETVEDVYFWIELTENSYSVFQGSDESIAYIIEVYTLQPADVSDTTLVDVSPAAGGYTFPLTPVNVTPAPEWITESGYSGNLQYFKDVKFALRVVEMQPSSFLGGWRNEQQVTFYLGCDVLLFGYWELVKDYNPWTPPIYGSDWLAVILEALATAGWIILGTVLSVAILATIGRRDIRIALIVLAVVWTLILVFGYGVLEGYI